jgi:glucose/arabinose dehydrogenase
MEREVTGDTWACTADFEGAEMTTKTAMLLSLTALVAAPMAFAQPVEQGDPNVGAEPAFPEQTRAPASDSGVGLAVETVAEGLEHPWAVAMLPGGDMLVTERPGRLRVIAPDGSVSEPVAGLPEVVDQEQGGLLDVAPGPDFAEERWIYWTYAKPAGEGMSVTAAARGKLAEDYSEVTEVEDIFVQEPPSPNAMHFGSRLAFDGEGHVFVTTGEHFSEEERVLAQDLGTTYGKIVRVGLDGSVPEDNPFAGQEGAIASIWSLGHRNVQAAAVDGSGQLWAIEHGPQGGDELNRIEAGANYGWPEVTYGENYSGTPVGTGEARHTGDFVEPRYFWDPVIAPSGMVFYEGDAFGDWEGDILVGSLTPGALVRLELDGETVVGEERLLTDQGRIRDVAIDGDGALLVVTDAPDGALLRLTPSDGET